MRNKLMAVLCLAVILCAMSLSGCECKHEWSDATCTEPSTCSKCGETQGEALGHDITAANCTKPTTCKRCDYTSGEALGHQMKKEETFDYVYAEKLVSNTCIYCGEGDTKSTSLTKLYNGTKFLFTPEEFYKRMDYILDREYDFSASGPVDFDKSLVYGMYNSSFGSLGYFTFYDQSASPILTKSSRNISALSIVLFDADLECVEAAACAMMAADPSLALADCVTILEKCNYGDEYTKNGITYKMSSNGDGVVLAIMLV